MEKMHYHGLWSYHGLAVVSARSFNSKCYKFCCAIEQDQETQEHNWVLVLNHRFMLVLRCLWSAQVKSWSVLGLLLLVHQFCRHARVLLVRICKISINNTKLKHKAKPTKVTQEQSALNNRFLLVLGCLLLIQAKSWSVLGLLLLANLFYRHAWVLLARICKMSINNTKLEHKAEKEDKISKNACLSPKKQAQPPKNLV